MLHIPYLTPFDSYSCALCRFPYTTYATRNSLLSIDCALFPKNMGVAWVSSHCGTRLAPPCPAFLLFAGRWSPACLERSRRVTVLHKSSRLRSSKSRIRNSFRMRSCKNTMWAEGVLFSASGGGCGPREVQRRGASQILPLRFPVPFTTNENTHPVLRSAPAHQTASPVVFLSASVPSAHRPEFPPRASAPPARSPE